MIDANGRPTSRADMRKTGPFASNLSCCEDQLLSPPSAEAMEIGLQGGGNSFVGEKGSGGRNPNDTGSAH